MQTQSNVVATILPAFLFFCLFAFLGVAWVINKIIKRKLINGALFFLVGGGVLLVIHILGAAHYSPRGAEAIGYVIGLYLFPALLGIYLARRFEKQKILESQENPEMSV